MSSVWSALLTLKIVQFFDSKEGDLLECDLSPVAFAFLTEYVHFLDLFGLAKRAFFLADDPLIKTRDVVRMPAFC